MIGSHTKVRCARPLLRVAGSNRATVAVGHDPAAPVRVTIEQTDTEDRSAIQLNFRGVALERGTAYTLGFRMRAGGPTTVGIGVARARPPWDNLGLYRELNVGPQWSSFTATFTASASEDCARFHIDLGRSSASTELADLELFRADDAARGWPGPGDGRVVDPALFRTLEPVSRQWGLDRGTPIDRYYIEHFIAAHAPDIHGRVLEIEDDLYSRNFGGTSTARDVLHLTPGNPRANIVADLADAPSLSSDHYDCVIITETLQYIEKLHAAAATLWRVLKPGGVILATLPGLSPTSQAGWASPWFWRFTADTARSIFGPLFGSELQIRTCGNVLVASAFLRGFAMEDLTSAELDHHDPDYDILVTVRAVKGGVRT